MKSYILGFVLSILLTLAAYFMTTNQVLQKDLLLWGVILIGIIQALIQLVLFLHLGKEPKPRLNFLTFLFMLSVVIIITGGSLWIMANLNYNMM
jgi:cytochrome o ubiquinol oxidase operon protein cyoD